MSIAQDMLNVIRNNPEITAKELRECLNANSVAVNTTLWRLLDSGKLVRAKVNRAAPKGPQSVYAYSLRSDDGIQKEAGEEVNAVQESSSSQTDGSGSPRSEVRQEGGYPPIYR